MPPQPADSSWLRRTLTHVRAAPTHALRSLREPASLQRWLILSFTAVGVSTAGLILLLLLPTLSGSLADERAGAASQAAALALAGAASRQVPPDPSLADHRNLQGFLADVAATIRGEARFVSPSGHTVASEPTLQILSATSIDPATRAILGGQQGAITQRVSRNGGEVVIAVGPIREDSQLRGALEIAIPIDSGEGAAQVVAQRAYWLVIAVLLISGLVGYRIAKILGRRLGRIAGVAAQLAGGDLAARAPATTPSELTSLSGSLNEMADRLEDQLMAITTERDRMQAMVATLEEAVVLIDEDDAVRIANPTAERLLGIAGSGPLPGEVSTWLSPGQAGEVDIAGRTLEGERLMVPGSSWSVLSARDVTAARRLEASRRELVANVSHELKTPLAALRGLIELMRENPRMAEQQRTDFLELMDREGQRLTRLVEEQLELARLDADALPLDRIHCDLGEIGKTVRDSRTELSAAAGVHLVWVTPSPPAPVCADPARIEQILFILLDNAVRHTPRGGQITMSVRAEPQWLHLDVSDTGEGIAAEDASVVFDRFYQADPSRTGSGAGLGLAIAQGLARAHGGHMSVHSRPGVGATFTLSLPRDTHPPHSAEDI